MSIRPFLLAFLATSAAFIAVPASAQRFTLCERGGRTDCVVDGDTFWMDGDKIRIADIDTPETHQPRCISELAHGKRATELLLLLLNAGTFALQTAGQDKDRYGRSLRIVSRGGSSVGGMLIAEGLARPWMGSRQPWCGS